MWSRPCAAGGGSRPGGRSSRSPPPLTAAIEFEPGRCPPARQLAQRMPPGWLIKATAVYDEPFWRADGLSGEALNQAGPVTMTFDNSPPSGSRGALVGFVGGRDARAFARLGPVRAPRRPRSAASSRCSGRGRGPPERYHRARLGGRALERRRPGLQLRHRRLDAPAARRCASPRPRSLGRHRDRDALDGLHRRRRQLRRARRGRGAGDAVGAERPRPPCVPASPGRLRRGRAAMPWRWPAGR